MNRTYMSLEDNNEIYPNIYDGKKLKPLTSCLQNILMKDQLESCLYTKYRKNIDEIYRLNETEAIIFNEFNNTQILCKTTFF